ncbi:MAG: hypothetical protein ABEJ26_14315 [Halosimplex sp.]
MVKNDLSAMRGLHPNSEMTVIGYTVFTLLLVVILPLLPFFLLYWVVDAFVGDDDRRVATGGDEDRRAMQYDDEPPRATD